MKAYEGVPRGRNQCRYAREKLERRHHSMFHPRRPRGAHRAHVFHSVRHNATSQDSQPSERHGRSCAVTAEPLAPKIVTSRDAHRRVDVEAFALGNKARFCSRKTPLSRSGIVVPLGRCPRKRTSLHGDLRTSLQRFNLHISVAARLSRGVGKVPVATEPSHRIGVRLSRKPKELLFAGSLGLMEVST
jgi:hypothetical protein